MALHVCTYLTHPEKAIYLFETAKLHGVHVENLANSTTWNGFQDRLLGVYEKIRTLPDEDIVCCIDSYDLLVNASPEKILEVFKQEKCELLYGAETGLFPHTLNAETYPTSTTQFRFLNAGCYIGYVHALKKLFSDEKMNELKGKTLGGPEDQGFMQTYFLDHYKTEPIKLNTIPTFAINMEKVSWDTLTIRHGVVGYDTFQTVPCFLHFNGMSYLDVQKDFIRTPENQLSFNYYGKYDTLFSAILGAKMLTNSTDTVVKLTGRGHTY